MTDPCWFPQVIQGEHALNILLVWNGFGTGMERAWNAM